MTATLSDFTRQIRVNYATLAPASAPGADRTSPSRPMHAAPRRVLQNGLLFWRLCVTPDPPAQRLRCS